MVLIIIFFKMKLYHVVCLLKYLECFYHKTKHSRAIFSLLRGTLVWWLLRESQGHFVSLDSLNIAGGASNLGGEELPKILTCVLPTTGHIFKRKNTVYQRNNCPSICMDAFPNSHHMKSILMPINWWIFLKDIYT